MTLPRGFASEAERRAKTLRADLGLSPHAPVNITEVASHLKVRIVDAEELIDRERLEEIERLQSYAFSAVTYEIRGRHIIVTNPLRSDERLASDIAHELSHLLLKHELSELREIDGVAFRTCRPEEEEQATALGGAILLPRPLLLRAADSGRTHEEIARRSGVTVEMARYRFNVTGVAKQVAARRRG